MLQDVLTIFTSLSNLYNYIALPTFIPQNSLQNYANNFGMMLNVSVLLAVSQLTWPSTAKQFITLQIFNQLDAIYIITNTQNSKMKVLVENQNFNL